MSKWTKESIKNSIERFAAENGRYPTARDFDKCIYLPVARYIQRNFGGLANLRLQLVPESPQSFRNGSVRSAVAKKSILRAYDSEFDFYEFLISKFPEVQVHEQKRLRPGNIASDFFVYTTESSGFAIDIFNSSDRFNTIGILNIKSKRYAGLQIPIVFIAIGDFDQESLNQIQRTKKIPLRPNVHLYTDKYFKENLSSLLKDILRDQK